MELMSSLPFWHCIVIGNACNDLLAQEWMSMPNPDIENPIPTSLRGTVLCTGVARGGVAQWDFLWKRYLASNNANEKNNILGALSCTGEVWLLQKYLDMSIRYYLQYC